MIEDKGNNSFNNIIREKIENLEYSYDPKQWERLEKDMSSLGTANQSGFFNPSLRKFGYALVGLAIIISTTIIYINTKSVENNTLIENAVNQHNTTINTHDNSKITKGNAPINQNTSKLEQSSNTQIEKSNNSDNIIKVVSNKQRIITENQKQEIAEKIEYQEENKESRIIIKNPNAKFFTTEISGCAPLKINFSPIETSDSIEYIWDFGDGEFSDKMNPSHSFKKEGNYIVSLNIKYPVSKKTSFFSLTNEIIVFPSPSSKIVSICNQNTYQFKLDEFTENTIKWYLNEDFITEDIESEHTFVKPGTYLLSCTIENQYSCISKLSELLDIKIVHDIAMPNAFRPNGDGSNDLFGPNEEYYNQYKLVLKIYNRSGELVFESNSSRQKWDGLMMGSGRIAPYGVYAYFLQSTDEYNNTCIKNGSITLIK